jgi:hypothetical protein
MLAAPPARPRLPRHPRFPARRVKVARASTGGESAAARLDLSLSEVVRETRAFLHRSLCARKINAGASARGFRARHSRTIVVADVYPVSRAAPTNPRPTIARARPHDPAGAKRPARVSAGNAQERCRKRLSTGTLFWTPFEMRFGGGSGTILDSRRQSKGRAKRRKNEPRAKNVAPTFASRQMAAIITDCCRKTPQ